MTVLVSAQSAVPSFDECRDTIALQVAAAIANVSLKSRDALPDHVNAVQKAPWLLVNDRVAFFDVHASLRVILDAQIQKDATNQAARDYSLSWLSRFLLPEARKTSLLALESKTTLILSVPVLTQCIQDELVWKSVQSDSVVRVALFSILYPFWSNASRLQAAQQIAALLPLTQWFVSVSADSKFVAGLSHVDEKFLRGGVQDGVPRASTAFVNQEVLMETGSAAPTGRIVLPKEGERNILITSALPYVNNVPHLGNIIGCVLSADVYARYCRLKGYNTLYICGTDEYGTATETKAIEEGLSCQALCDKYHVLQKEIYDWFDIGFDYFGRTTTPQQTEIAQDIFLKLHDRQLLCRESVQQLYCESCHRYLADRFVEGTCPLCGFHDARGDQCDGCGKLLNATELVKPRCKLDGNTPIIKSSTHMFLDLPQLQPECEKWVAASSEAGQWTTNGISITNAWLKEGLKLRCITRDLKWGTPVPLEDMSDKVFYVWFDAPIGYLSITANYTEEWRKWWQNPSQVQLYQFMGKDNVPFHTVIFPCSLIGTRDPYTLLHHISTTEYLNYEDGKFSKSRNIGVFGNNVMDSNIPCSVWRWYLLMSRPESNDSVFTWDDFAAKVNTELLANLGNLVSRTVKFLQANYDSVVPLYKLTELEEKFIAKMDEELNQYHEAMEGVHLRAGLRSVMALSALGNAYLSEVGLDKALLVNAPERCATAMALSANLVYALASLLEPFMPSTAAAILRQLAAPARRLPLKLSFDLLPGHRVGTPGHLFRRLEEKEVQQLRQRYGGNKPSATKDGAKGTTK